MKSLEYLLLAKKDIELECGLKIKQYSISEIEESIGYSEYEFMIWAMSRYNYEFQFDLEDNGLDYNNFSTYDIFVMLIQNKENSKVIESLNFIFDDLFVVNNNKLTSSKTGVEINIKTIEEIKKILCKMFFFKKPRKRKPANDDAKRLIKLQIKRNRNKKVKYDIYSIMHSIVWSQNSSETYDSILNKTPYQIYAGFQHIEKINRFNNTMDGIYSGVIKKDDIDFDGINWINKIES